MKNSYNTKEIIGNFEKESLNPFASLNIHARPFISKITISLNLSSTGSDKKVVDAALKEISALSGAKPVVVLAKKSDAIFKIREGQPTAIKITLRSSSMYSFLDKLIYAALPRLRDFRGLKTSFDKIGNLSFTLPGGSFLFFESNFIQDANMAICIQNSSPEKSKVLMSAIRLPFFN